MISPLTRTSSNSTPVRVHGGAALAAALPRLEAFALRGEQVPLNRHPAWLNVFARAFGHTVYALEVADGERTRGYLPLSFVRSLLFGRFLVSLPYLNTSGVLADDGDARHALIGRAADLADELNVRYLELRHETGIEHPALTGKLTSKVHLRLPLPSFPGPLWEQISGKVRNQVRKGEKSGLTAHWGTLDLLPDFYAVFSRNMRDLGTPVYGQTLFRAILQQFPRDAELCVVRLGELPVAGALLLHGKGITEVPSASSLREYNHLCANMLLYWQLLERTVNRGQAVFDFGRSTVDSNTFKFKKQWGAEPRPATWQYYPRSGHFGDMRPDNPRYQRLIRIWQKLPLRLTRWIGPAIVRGIP